MIKIQHIILYALLLTIVGCSSEGDSEEVAFPTLTYAPKSVELNLEEGYETNQFNGNAIEPLVTIAGDTVKTGEPILLEGKTVDMGTEFVTQPFNINFTDAIKNNIIKIPSDLPSQVLTEDMLEERRMNSERIDFQLLNPIGEEITTGVPVIIEPKEVDFYYTEPKEALDFSINKEAYMDIQYLDMEHGLKASYIRALYHDSKGQIWMGTDGTGLAKYDGESISYLASSDNLEENSFFSIIEDKKGNIWASSFHEAVFKFDGNKFTTYPQENGMPSDFIFRLFEDSKGNIWFGSWGSGLSMYDGEQFIHFSEKEGLSGTLVHSISEAKNGNILITTDDGGMNILNPDLIGNQNENLFQHIDIENGLATNSLHDAIMDKNGTIWIATYGNGIYAYNDNELVNYSVEAGLSSNYVNDLYEDKAGNLWIGTYEGGLNLFTPSSSVSGHATFTHIGEAEGLNNNIILNITEDKSGKILVGTDGGGLNRITPNSFLNYTEKNGLGIKYINDIYEDQDKNIWLATWGAGIDFIQDGKIMHLEFDENNYSNSAWTIEPCHNGDILFGTSHDGLMRFDGEQFTFISRKNGLAENYVRTILEDKNENVWVGMNRNGIAKIEENTITGYNHLSGLSQNDIMCSLEDADGTLWFGTRGGGICKIDGDTLINITEKEGLSDNGVWAIEQDTRGNMWLGTESGGLCMFDGEKFTYYSMQNGLPTNSASSITEDRNGTLWIGTPNGLVAMDYKNAQDNEFVFKSYGRQDGLRGIDFYVNSSFLDSDNNLWFGTGKSLVKKNIAGFDDSINCPAPQLNWITINEQFIDFRNPPDSLDANIHFEEVAPFANYPTSLSLPHYSNHLSFNFSAIEWNAPHQILYSFRIKELKSSWSKPSKSSHAEYRNLSPGEYTFEFISCGQSQEWSKPFQFKFEIRPPWWQTAWAKTFFVALFAVVLLLLYKWRTRQLQARQKMLVQEVKSATKEIRAQKAEVEKAHAETEQQKEIIEESHKEITDSIAYAKRLQDAILPSLKEISNGFENSFVLFQPKDVVSGDFYWFEKTIVNGKEVKYIAAADCTGHGVPGALVSVVCSNALNRSLNEFKITDPNLILNNARDLVIKTFAKSGDGVKDGMDISLCAIENNILKYSGANNPIWIVRKTEHLSPIQKEDAKTESKNDLSLIEFKADKQPVGMHSGAQVDFSQTEIELFEGDTIYLFTDGFPDQFGGDKGKKYKYKPFKQLLLKINGLAMNVQEEHILKELNDWKGTLEQVDDICVIGVRV